MALIGNTTNSDINGISAFHPGAKSLTREYSLAHKIEMKADLPRNEYVAPPPKAARHAIASSPDTEKFHKWGRARASEAAAIKGEVLLPSIAAYSPLEDDRWPIEQVCEFFGGKLKPLDPSTLYKGIQAGRYPSPVKTGDRTSRWIPSECYEARRLIEAARAEKFLKASERARAARNRKRFRVDDSRLIAEMEYALAALKASQPRSSSPA